MRKPTVSSSNRIRPHVRPMASRQQHRRDIQEEYVRELIAATPSRPRARTIVLRRPASAM